ncbi:MarR family winged helix-turn-helix transcriptional regulator [Nocardioides sp. CPCC 205120]|uniref:MarR family winged helix-turn-helix transcriptional regulator n=1 Tax=Nocardioides sp. CPCC 205120 TaxID=3406462 RepID=UPI003B514990
MTEELADETRWLAPDEQRSWRALLIGTTLLMDQLDEELRSEFSLSLTEYEILVRLSETPEGSMRMALLADAVRHSRSRITHTVTRMEKAGLVARSTCVEDGRGVLCVMTEHGWDVLRRAAHVHVRGVRRHLVDIVDPADFAAMGRVMDAVADALIGARPGLEIR